MNKKGFSLLEMLIVLTVVSILIPTVFSIVYVIMRQQARIYRVVETRRQGDSILTFIKDRIVRSKQMTNYSPSSASIPQCATAGSTYVSVGGASAAFLDNAETRFRIRLDSTNNNLLYESPPGGTATPLNNNLVAVEDFSIRCARTALTGAPLIQVSYTVRFKDTTAIEDGTIVLPYQTIIKLRE